MNSQSKTHQSSGSEAAGEPFWRGKPPGEDLIVRAPRGKGTDDVLGGWIARGRRDGVGLALGEEGATHAITDGAPYEPVGPGGVVRQAQEGVLWLEQDEGRVLVEARLGIGVPRRGRAVSGRECRHKKWHPSELKEPASSIDVGDPGGVGRRWVGVGESLKDGSDGSREGDLISEVLLAADLDDKAVDPGRRRESLQSRRGPSCVLAQRERWVHVPTAPESSAACEDAR
mmetsp:Transcript_19226/g.60483  ORF Transcript_19226/g.60483 Transcript_19226/m.60483 type:complete len:229 (-) Transcript_19226:185-871(-)